MHFGYACGEGAMQIAQILFEANGKNAKDTIDLLTQTIKFLMTSGQTVGLCWQCDLQILSEQQQMQNVLPVLETESTETWNSKNRGDFVESRKNRSSVRSKAVRSKIGEERLRNREFAWKSNLNTHLHIHDASRRKTFVCKYPNCGKSFYDAQHLKQHEWIHKRTPDVLDLSAREL